MALMSTRRMAPEEFLHTLERLKLSPEELALYLQVKPARIASWRTGARSIPTWVAARLRWLLARLERDLALNRLGAPVCGWLLDWEAHAPPVRDLPATFAYLQQREDHRLTCDVCQAREALVAANRLELPPRPLSPVERLMHPLPTRGPTAWPVLLGACAFSLIAFVRIVVGLLGPHPGPADLIRAVTDCLLSAVAGAVAGWAFATSRPFVNRLERLRYPMAGIALVGSYMAGMLLASRALFGNGQWTWAPGLWITWAVFSLVVGSIVGHTFFRPDPDLPTRAV